MRWPIRLFVASLVAGGLTQTGHAQEAERVSVFEIRDVVRDLAFDPAKFFPSQYVPDRSTVRIVYTGDDYGWPVYAIAVAEGCVGEETIRQGECASRVRARMVRAPAPPDMSRPRQRGLHLLNQLAERGATSPELIRPGLQEAGVEWVEADLRSCAGALEALGRSTGTTWVPEAVANPAPGDELAGLVLHADIIKVEFQQYARLSTYRGWIAPNSPAAWAETLASTLEPCWRPARAPAPWSTGD